MANRANSDSMAAQFIAAKEGFSATPFWDHHQWTWGYGTNAAPGNTNSASNPGGTITRERALSEMKSQLSRYAAPVDALDSRYNWTDAERAALISFSYNLGPGKISNLTANGTRTKAEIADAILLYDKASGQRVAGLTRRRQEERAMFTNNAPLPDLPLDSETVGVTNGAEGSNTSSASDESNDYASARNLSDIWRMANDKGDFWDNELDVYDFYTYNLEFFVVDEETTAKFLGSEYNLDDIVSDAWPGNTHKRVSIAMTGASTEFNVHDLNVESLGYGSGSNAKMSGHAVSLSFNITQVGNTSLADSLQNAAVLCGYKSTLDAIWYMKVKFIGYTGDTPSIIPAVKVLPFKLTDFRDLQTSTDARGTSSVLNGMIVQQHAFATTVNLVDETFTFEMLEKHTLNDVLNNFISSLNDSIRAKNYTGDEKFINTYSVEVDEDFKKFLPSKMNGTDANRSTTNNTVEKRVSGLNIAKHVGTVSPGMNIYNIITDICNQALDVKEELTKPSDTFTDMVHVSPSIIPEPGGLNVLTNTRGHKVTYHIGIRRTPIVQNQADLNLKVQSSAKMVNEIMGRGRLRKCYYHQYTGLNDQILDLQVSLNKQLQKTYVAPTDEFVFANFVKMVGGKPFPLNDLAQQAFDEARTEANTLDIKSNKDIESLEGLRIEMETMGDDIKSDFMRELESSGAVPQQAITDIFSEDMNLEQIVAAMNQFDEGVASGVLNSQKTKRIQEFVEQLKAVEATVAANAENIAANNAEIDDIMLQAMGAKMSDALAETTQSASANFELLGLDKENSGFVLIEDLETDFIKRLTTEEFIGLIQTMMDNPTVFKRAVVSKIKDINRTTVLRSSNQDEIEIARQKYYEGLNVDISMQNLTMTIKGDPFWLNNYITPKKAKEKFGNLATMEEYKNYTVDFSGQNYAMVIVNKAAGTDEFDNIKIANLFISVYVVKTVTSSFSSGLFTQTLTMNKMPFPADFTALNPTIDAVIEVNEDEPSIGDGGALPAAFPDGGSSATSGQSGTGQQPGGTIPGQPSGNNPGDNAGTTIFTGGDNGGFDGTPGEGGDDEGDDLVEGNGTGSELGDDDAETDGTVSNGTNDILANPISALETMDQTLANGLATGNIPTNEEPIVVSRPDSPISVTIPTNTLTAPEQAAISPMITDFKSPSASPEIQTSIADGIQQVVDNATMGDRGKLRDAKIASDITLGLNESISELEAVEERLDGFYFDQEERQKDIDYRNELQAQVAIQSLAQPKIEIMDIQSIQIADNTEKTVVITKPAEISTYTPNVLVPDTLNIPDEPDYVFGRNGIKRDRITNPSHIVLPGDANKGPQVQSDISTLTLDPNTDTTPTPPGDTPVVEVPGGGGDGLVEPTDENTNLTAPDAVQLSDVYDPLIAEQNDEAKYVWNTISSHNDTYTVTDSQGNTFEFTDYSTMSPIEYYSPTDNTIKFIENPQERFGLPTKIEDGFDINDDAIFDSSYISDAKEPMKKISELFPNVTISEDSVPNFMVVNPGDNPGEQIKGVRILSNPFQSSPTFQNTTVKEYQQKYPNTTVQAGDIYWDPGANNGAGGYVVFRIIGTTK